MRQNINSKFIFLVYQDISGSKCPVNVMYAQEKIIFSLCMRLYANFNDQFSRLAATTMLQ